jgi:signal transduction histidine kinase
MLLSEFILVRKELIMQEWEDFARTILPEAKMDDLALRNHISRLLDFIAKDIGSAQTKAEQSDKSKGWGDKEGGKKDSAAETHALMRYESGFDIIQMASEFRALRASVITLWSKESDKAQDECEEVNRFHESIDQMQMEALARYNDSLNRARNLFLGTLIHDMRSPLSAVANAAEVLKATHSLDETQKKMIGVIERGNRTVAALVSDLIDAIRVQLGKGMPISPAPMNLGEAVRNAAQDAEVASQRGAVRVETEGDLDGKWDGTRMRQVLTNLIGNALQHGASGGAVDIVAKGEPDGVVMSVHNWGKPIPDAEIPAIFDPLNRGKGKKQKQSEASSLGLGLFISKEIVRAHGGEIDVASTEKDGTTFTIRLPRESPGA